MGSAKTKKRAANAAIYALLIIICILWLIPFVLILLQSLRAEPYSGMSGYILPRIWGLKNYVYLFRETSFPVWYGNTLIIALASALLQTAMVMLTGYGLSRLRFKGRRFLMNAVLVLGMFPGFLTMIILYYVLKSAGMTQSGAVPGLILVYVASSGMGYYVAKGFLDTIPRSLDEAARVDGATKAQIFWRVTMPLSKPIIIYTLLTAFMAPFTDYIFASYIAFGEPSGYNVAVGLYSWLQKDMISSHFTAFCAGGVCVAVPVTLLFLLLQKYYVEGVTGGAVKG
ncbi:MAG: ABC transporter permease subunit [Clostridia bacterium]|nr:ABC transporter permease subunit [Clostridia bacterium]MBQ4327622.1 ABC transporter permease subunit [Clostridia bacterium]